MAKQICIQCSGPLTPHKGFYKRNDGVMWPCGYCKATGYVDEEINFPKRFAYVPENLVKKQTSLFEILPYALMAIISFGCLLGVIQHICNLVLN